MLRLDGSELWPLPWWLDAACGLGLVLLGALLLQLAAPLGSVAAAAGVLLVVAGLGWMLLVFVRPATPVLGRIWLVAVAGLVAAMLAAFGTTLTATAQSVMLGTAALLVLAALAASVHYYNNHRRRDAAST